MTVRRRAMPAVLTLLSLLLDTSVIPFLISSPYIVSLTFSTVLVLGVYLGRMHGMLYGLIAGLLLDILVGYQLGFNTFVYIALGFLAGLIAYEPEDARARRRPSRVYLRRALTFFGLTLLREVAIYAYQYLALRALKASISSIYSSARCSPPPCACCLAPYGSASPWARARATGAHPPNGR